MSTDPFLFRLRQGAVKTIEMYLPNYPLLESLIHRCMTLKYTWCFGITCNGINNLFHCLGIKSLLSSNLRIMIFHKRLTKTRYKLVYYLFAWNSVLRLLLQQIYTWNIDLHYDYDDGYHIWRVQIITKRTNLQRILLKKRYEIYLKFSRWTRNTALQRI